MASALENTLSAGLNGLANETRQAFARALYEFAHTYVLTPAQERTPVDYGTLKGSGLVDQPKINADSIIVEVGFGGAAAHYAIYVHEDLDAKHEVGQAKFLSSAMDEAAGKFTDVVGAYVARALGM